MNFIRKIFDIQATSDPERSIKSISDAVSIRGYNMWLLICSSILASIGLDTNSTAVIIGAMLISPLMSPILGIGLAIGTQDNTLLNRSLRNFAVAIILSLAASILYFLISPFASPTTEIQNRTFPTLLDVLVAFFGGIAGIVSSARSGPTVAIPGVAIATALMPPLCTAGYGIATGNLFYFGGAFYLFFINAVFISLATYLIVKYLHFPRKGFSSQRQRRYYSLTFILLVIMVTLPSIYFLYSVIKKEQTRKMIDKLVFMPIKSRGDEILKWELARTDTLQFIKVYYSGPVLNDSIISLIDESLRKNDLTRYQLQAIRINMTKEEVNELSEDVTRNMFQQFRLEFRQQRDAETEKKDSLSFSQVAKEVKIAFPFVDSLSNGWLLIPGRAGGIDTIPAIYYRPRARTTSRQIDQLRQFLQIRFRVDSIGLYAEK